jgi:hypothetical protein
MLRVLAWPRFYHISGFSFFLDTSTGVFLMLPVAEKMWIVLKKTLCFIAALRFSHSTFLSDPYPGSRRWLPQNLGEVPQRRR